MNINTDKSSLHVDDSYLLSRLHNKPALDDVQGWHISDDWFKNNSDLIANIVNNDNVDKTQVC